MDMVMVDWRSFSHLQKPHLPFSMNHEKVSKLYGVNATTIIFVFVLYCIVMY